MKSTNRLKWYHFLVAWLLCLLSSLIIINLFIVFMNGFSDGWILSIITVGIALVASAPFIIVFCIIIHFTTLKKGLSRKIIHLRVFLWHIIGSFCVFVGLIGITNSEAKSLGFWPIVGIMFGYFLLDSIYFHTFIQYYSKNIEQKLKDEFELLD